MARPNVPTVLKVLNGTAQTSRLNKAEPKLAPRIPDAPEHLAPDELAAWRYFAAILEPMGVVTHADAPALEMLAVTFAHHQRLAAQLRQGALVYESTKPNGDIMLRSRPELAAIGDVGRRVLVLLGRFGLTPADRAKVVSTSDDSPADPYAEFGG
jgi:P27 family predicted phage terminase small subunit